MKHRAVLALAITAASAAIAGAAPPPETDLLWAVRIPPRDGVRLNATDVVEWLATQPWCDGKVAMWGGSYAGYDQWATLQNFPPHLATIVPAAAAAMGVDFPAQNNIFVPYLMQWATYTSGVTPQPNLFGDASFWISKYRELYFSGRPFREFDRMVGNPSPWFQRVLQHPRVDELWKSLRPGSADYARIAIPILTITGHYDDDQYGAMHYYRSHMEHGAAEANERPGTTGP